MGTLENRLLALESAEKPIRGQVPHVVPDNTPQAEIDRLRQLYREVLRFSEFLDVCI